jgi:hypothetical protein
MLKVIVIGLLLSCSAFCQVPTWTGSFSYQGTIYRYTMVGTSPIMTNKTTTVPVYLIPLSFTFVQDGTRISAEQTACGDTQSAETRTLVSPLFDKTTTYTPGGINVGTTQYVDAFQRANFWRYVGTMTPKYHVLFAGPVVEELQSLTILPRQGGATRGICTKVGEVDVNYFDTLAQAMIMSLGIPKNSLPIFLSYDVFWTQNGQCCLLGYHNVTAGGQGYVVASYNDPCEFSPCSEADVNTLSHEMAEYVNDPLTNNIVPPWGTTGNCSTYLEVGDPLNHHQFQVAVNGFTYNLQDLMFHDWFTRSNPSSSVKQWYTFANGRKTAAAICN